MMGRIMMSVVGAGAAAALAGAAWAGPEWNEAMVGDAGPLPINAQEPAKANPPLTLIEGRLNGDVQGAGPMPPDFQDMYKILICEPAIFTATAVSVGAPDLFPQLFLFDEDGLGVVGNAPGGTTAFLDSMPDDAPPGFVLAEGIYFLAISGGGFPPPGTPGAGIGVNVPLSPGGEMFAFDFVGQQSIADGPGGGSMMISDWSAAPVFPLGVGDYAITLTGVKVVPAPGAGVLLVTACAGAAGRRRRA